MTALPHRLVAWYGDDFTGSTDVLEVLASRRIPAVLFLGPPSGATRARFEGYRAFGMAGSSRSRAPEWMDANLPAVFETLASFAAPVVHYKVCSTFDSSPAAGSIGRALEIGRRVLKAQWVPIVAGAPALGRYTAFGHLFAKSGNAIERIDRHPMSRHPVTPMRESDLRLHLAKQTGAGIGLLHLAEPDPEAALRRCLEAGDEAVLIDVLDDRTLARAGELMWDSAPVFAVGSSGVEYALAAHWGFESLANAPIEPVERLLVLSGSCSPVTGRQIRVAARAGFESVRLDDQAAARACASLAAGKSVVIYSAIGPGDQVAGDAEFRDRIARLATRTLVETLDASGAGRVVIAGGDTSSHVGAALGIDALTFVARAATGAPLCRAWSGDPRRNGLEIVFKGGQVGEDDFFVQARGY